MAANVTVAETKAHLSALIERVQRGEEITITRHGKPVARLLAAPSGPVVREAGDWGWPAGSYDPAVFAPMDEDELRREGWM